MGDRITIIERPHDNLGDDAEPHHEWVDVWLREHQEEFGDRETRRDTLGRRNGGMTIWRRWCCNDLRCSGVLLVNTSAVTRLVQEAAADSLPTPTPQEQGDPE